MGIKSFNDFSLNEEIDWNIIPTNYSIINIVGLFVNSGQDVIYRFTSNGGNSYDVYFSITHESNHLLSDGSNLYNYSTGSIPTIFFSLTERGVDPNVFDNPVNRNEYLEIMGKVVYLILEFISSHNYSVYSIGEVAFKKYKFYSNYKKYFTGFNIIEGPSDNYNGHIAYYLIK